MAITKGEVGVWTDVPAVAGDMLLEARGIGFYVDTTGTNPANAPDGYALASNSSMVIKAGLPVAIQPAQDIRSVIAVSNPV